MSFTEVKDGFDLDAKSAWRNEGLLGGWPFLDFSNNLKPVERLSSNKDSLRVLSVPRPRFHGVD